MAERNFSMVEYFIRRARSHRPRYRFEGKSKEDFQQWQKALMMELRAALGPEPERVDLNPQIEEEVEEDGLIRRKVVLDSEADYSMVARVCIPAGAKKDGSTPAILCNHGHGFYAKDSVMGVRPEGDTERAEEIKQFNYDYGVQMAKRGYVTIAVDWRGWGERDEPIKEVYLGRDVCNVHFIRGLIMGINLLRLDVWDGQRALDYLCGLEEVDAERVGVMGLSFGGTMTTWISLMDERIKAADIICYSDRFAEFAVKNANFCGSQIVPDIFKFLDTHDIAGLIAPRPLLLEMGVHDTTFSIENLLTGYEGVKRIYEAAGAADDLWADVHPGGHAFAGDKAYAFFAKYL